MTKLRTHYNASLKAFVPDSPVDVSDGAPAWTEPDVIVNDKGGATLADLADAAALVVGGLDSIDDDIDSVDLVRQWRDHDISPHRLRSLVDLYEYWSDERIKEAREAEDE